jgi:hypothetical protein
MKKPLRYIIVGLALLGGAWLYSERAVALRGFSRIATAQRVSSSAYAKDYESAVACNGCDISKEKRKILWDLWCVAMEAQIDPPLKLGERLLLRVRATDRTDTQFIYVFDAGGEIVEIARIPLA